MKDSQDWLDDILSDFAIWDVCGQDDCEHYREYKQAKSAIREHFLKEALSLIPEQADEDGSTGKWVNGFNDANAELRNKFNDKYKED